MNHISYLLVFLLTQIISSQRSRGREHTSNDYINLAVNRTIDLRYSVISINTRILTKSLKVDPIYSYRLPILKNNTKSLISISAKLANTQNENEDITLKITKQSYVNDENFEFYEINFKNEPINYEEERYIVINEDYYERLDLFPKKINLKEDQLVVFKDTINHVAFYQTNNQTTNVVLKREKTEVM